MASSAWRSCGSIAAAASKRPRSVRSSSPSSAGKALQRASQSVPGAASSGAAPDVTPATAAKLLREAAAEWQAIGPVPRAHEVRVEKRYHAAVAQVQHHADLAKRAAGLAQAGQLRDKLRLVQELEQAVAADGEAPEADWEADWDARWSALPAPAGELDRILLSRFEAARQALREGDAAYARQLEANRERLLNDLLRMEIAAGIDSGPEFARERLKLQVEVLQSSLKSGHRPASGGRPGQGGAQQGASGPAAQLRELCALPALVDARTASRIEHLVMRLAREGA